MKEKGRKRAVSRMLNFCGMDDIVIFHNKESHVLALLMFFVKIRRLY